MKNVFNTFLQRFTFRRQLTVTVTLGILLLALFSSVVGSWQSNERVRRNLIEQGLHITEALASQSGLALIYASPDNAVAAANATLAFPGVVNVEIRDINQQVLLALGNTPVGGVSPVGSASGVAHDGLPAFDSSTTSGQITNTASVDAENKSAWRFMAPVYTQPSTESPFESPFSAQTAKPELLGHILVVVSKAALAQTTNDIFISNLTTSFSFALVFLLLIRILTKRMTQPLNQLSISMGRAEAGESNVRAKLTGSRDIAEMAHAFNSMMAVLEQREAALRVAAIAFEVEEGMIVTDQNEVIVRVNRVFTQLSGYSADDAIGKKLGELKSDDNDADFYPRLQEALHRNNFWQGEIRNRRKNGEIYPEWLTITAVVGTDKNISNYIAAFFDITERKLAEEKIHNLAFYDPLTQLPNRRLLFDRLNQAVATSVRNQTPAALLFIDLDNFKTLNDTRGHDIGDQLLIEVGQRLRGCIRERDTLARLGGDEFVVLLEYLNEDETQAALHARGVGEKVLKATSQPYMLKNVDHYSTASIGISLFSNYRQNLDDLLKQADTAMYAAKKAGRNTLRFFDPAMQETLELHSRIEAGIRKALPRQEFRLYYQLQVDSERRPIGAEALIRWLHPEEGMISPAKFIPVAEDTGLILPLGQWVLETACKQLKAWEEIQHARDLSLAVNVSARQFRKPDFVNQVSEMIEQTGINPVRLKLELTESTVLENVVDTIAKMQALKQVGVRFSMDDFGTGYSSLAYLTQLPLDQLKIDQSFVRNIGIKSSDAVIVQTIIGMANNLGIEVIAEGVETQDQRDFLWTAGCKLYQGYLFGKPIPSEEFMTSLIPISTNSSAENNWLK